MRRQRQHSALHFHRGHVFGFKFLGGKIVRLPRIDFGAARKDIDRRKTEFRPRVDGQMRFGNHDHARDPVRIERMKDHIHDACFGRLGRIDHNGFDFMDIVQDFGVAVVKFDEKMTSERSQDEKIIDLLSEESINFREF